MAHLVSLSTDPSMLPSGEKQKNTDQRIGWRKNRRKNHGLSQKIRGFCSLRPSHRTQKRVGNLPALWENPRRIGGTYGGFTHKWGAPRAGWMLWKGSSPRRELGVALWLNGNPHMRKYQKRRRFPKVEMQAHPLVVAVRLILFWSTKYYSPFLSTWSGQGLKTGRFLGTRSKWTIFQLWGDGRALPDC